MKDSEEILKLSVQTNNLHSIERFGCYNSAEETFMWWFSSINGKFRKTVHVYTSE